MTGPGGGVRSLWLMRHAKAAEPGPGERDHRRPLTARGHRDAEACGRRLVNLGLPDVELPTAMLCSTARRTTETASDVAGHLGIAPDGRHALYDAGPDDVLAEIRCVVDNVRALMVVGHNPTTHALAVELLSREDPKRALLDRFPTAALAVLRLPAGRWADVSYGQGELAGFFTPPY